MSPHCAATVIGPEDPPFARPNLRAGLAAAQAQDRATALVYLERLRGLIPEGSEAHQTVSDAIDRLNAINTPN